MFTVIYRLLFLLLTITASAEPLATDPELIRRESMVLLSKQLGVTCTYCHNPNNFQDSSRPTFGIAKNHLRVVALLNSQQGFNGSPKVDCFVCHRGHAKVDYKMPSK